MKSSSVSEVVYLTTTSPYKNVYGRFNVSIQSILLLTAFKNLLELSTLSRMQVKLPSVSSLVHNFTTNHDSAIYHYIKQLTKSYTLPPKLHFDSKVVNTDYSKAELFNQYTFSPYLPSVILNSLISMNPLELTLLLPVF